MIVAQRLRKGSCASARGAKRLVADAVKTARRLLGPRHAGAGADGLGVLRPRPGPRRARRRRRRCRSPSGWTPRSRPRSPASPRTRGRRSSTPTRSSTRPPAVDLPGRGRRDRRSPRSPPEAKADQVPGRLIVRRIPDFNADKHRAAGQDALFDVWRFHAFFTTTDPTVLDTVTADKTHRGHAIIEQVHADLKNSALAHLPSGVFTANAAWLVLAVIAFNLTRAAATLTGPGPGQGDHRDRPSQTDPHPVPGSRPPPDGSPCTYPRTGPGRPPGPSCSPASRTHPPPRPPDHPADTGPTEDPTWNTLAARPGPPPRHKHHQPTTVNARRLRPKPIGGSRLRHKASHSGGHTRGHQPTAHHHQAAKAILTVTPPQVGLAQGHGLGAGRPSHPRAAARRSTASCR